MPVDINGYALSNVSGLKFGASNTKIVAASYGVSDPLLPAMLGSATLGGSTYKIYPFPINDVNFNVGSPWSTSTYMFTAPVAGIYYTSYSGMVKKLFQRCTRWLLRGLTMSGTAAGIATLPAGYRPGIQLLFGAQTNPNVMCRIDISTAGGIAHTGGNNGWLVG